MDFCSTRNRDLRVTSAQAILQGLSEDGGLFTPVSLPSFSAQQIEDMAKMNYRQVAEIVLSAFLPDYTREEIAGFVEGAYGKQFDVPEVAPVRKFREGAYSLELWHGPTCAFKDFALQMLPRLLPAAAKKCGSDKTVAILVATSGDTGKAALAGFQDVPGVRICVFYPDGGVSAVQRAQMVTQEGENVTVSAIQGNFDNAQTGVKNIFAACRDGKLLEGKGFKLSSANSINIGRLAPQIMYYFRSYRDLLDAGKITLGEEVNFSVPTGNFGDILAGWLAGALGLPVGKLICASNANNVLTDFIRTGTYDKRRPLLKTTSPSMDILVSSNLERLLYLLSGDTKLVAELMGKLNKEGSYTVPDSLLEKIQTEFTAYYCDDARAEEVMGRVYKDLGYLCDPHTASGWAAAEDYVKETGDNRAMVVLSTASPYKFPVAVLTAIGGDTSGNEFEQMERLSAMTNVPIPRNLSGLQGKEEKHTGVIPKDKMLEYVLSL